MLHRRGGVARVEHRQPEHRPARAPGSTGRFLLLTRGGGCAPQPAGPVGRPGGSPDTSGGSDWYPSPPPTPLRLLAACGAAAVRAVSSGHCRKTQNTNCAKKKKRRNGTEKTPWSRGRRPRWAPCCSAQTGEPTHQGSTATPGPRSRPRTWQTCGRTHARRWTPCHPCQTCSAGQWRGRAEMMGRRTLDGRHPEISSMSETVTSDPARFTQAWRLFTAFRMSPPERSTTRWIISDGRERDSEEAMEERRDIIELGGKGLKRNLAQRLDRGAMMRVT